MHFIEFLKLYAYSLQISRSSQHNSVVPFMDLITHNSLEKKIKGSIGSPDYLIFAKLKLEQFIQVETLTKKNTKLRKESQN